MSRQLNLFLPLAERAEARSFLFSDPLVPVNPVVAKIQDAPDPPANGIFVSLRKASKGEAVVIYCKPLATQEMGYHRLSFRIKKMTNFLCTLKVTKCLFDK